MSTGNVPVQIETCALPPKSELNPLHFPVNGVCGECTRCGKRAEANPADEHGGPVTRRKAAIAAALAKLTAACEHRLPWGVAPKHEDRRIPRGVTVWCEELSTGRLLAVAPNEQGKLVGVWGGVAWEAPVLVIPDTDATLGDADDFAQRLANKGYTRCRVGKPGTAPKREQPTEQPTGATP